MALPITTPTDYVGSVKISQGQFKQSELLIYITEFEEQYIREALNDLIFNEIKAQGTLDQKYVDLIDGKTYINDCGDETINRGLKKSLLNWGYYHFVSENFVNTNTGNVINNNENANNTSPEKNAQLSFKRWNKGVEIYNQDVWPFVQFYASISEIATNSVDNTGTYTISIPSTLYLVDGNTVTISGTEYIVSGLITDTSIVITEATTGLDFTDEAVVWEPFKDVCFENFGNAWG